MKTIETIGAIARDAYRRVEDFTETTLFDVSDVGIDALHKLGHTPDTTQDDNALAMAQSLIEYGFVTAVKTMKVMMVIGNPINGLSLTGPFESVEAAAEYAEERGFDDWWAVTINQPSS